MLSLFCNLFIFLFSKKDIKENLTSKFKIKVDFVVTSLNRSTPMESKDIDLLAKAVTNNFFTPCIYIVLRVLKYDRVLFLFELYA